MKITKILALAFAAFLWVGQVDAQVSVRRTSRSTEQSGDKKPARSKDSKKAETKDGSAKADKPARRTLSSDDSQSPETKKGGNPVAAKRVAPAKKQQQAPVVSEGKTLRQQAFDAYQKDEVEETPWQHIVYRELDMTKDDNASLYFPIEPMDGLTSLFRVIMDAVVKGELPVYEYLDGREVFTEKFQVKPKDILDKYDIYYQTKPASQRGGQEILEVAESDVPSSEVLSYFVKERWEFDQKHSRYHARVLCICPVLHRTGDFSSESVKYPMFWIKYEDLRPFLRDHLVISQGMNTAARFTMEEYFSLHQYKGDIYKEQNLRGLSLKQQVGDNPDTLRMVQEKLDADLRSFEDSIWIKDPQPEVVPNKKTQKVEKKAEKEESESSQPTGATKKNRRTKETVDLDAAAQEREEKATTQKSVRR